VEGVIRLVYARVTVVRAFGLIWDELKRVSAAMPGLFKMGG
jgi:hypothetical protein